MKHLGPSTFRDGKDKQKKRLISFIKLAQGTPIKPRKQRAIEVEPRDRVEDRFRNEVVYPFLKKDPRIIDYKRIENGVNGRHGRGIPDFMFWTRTGFFWLELKAGANGLDKHQIAFKNNCIRTGTNHITAWSIKDIEEGIA